MLHYNQCSYMCKSNLDLSNHIKRIHDETFQKYSCDQCSYKAERQDYLKKKHVQSKHDNVRYLCHICGHQATRKQYLASHLEKVHKNTN